MLFARHVPAYELALVLVVSACGQACGSSASSQETSPPVDAAAGASCEASNSCGVGLPPISDNDATTQPPCGSFTYPCREGGGTPPPSDAANVDAPERESSTPDGGADSRDSSGDAKAEGDAGNG